MKVFKQIAIICLFCLIGEVISFGIKSIIPIIYIPGALIGMVLLFICLYFKWIKLEHVDNVGTFFVNNMGFFFIPAAVSVMDHFDILTASLWKILIVCIISFFITFISIALTVQLTLVIQEKKLKKEENNNEGNIQ